MKNNLFFKNTTIYSQENYDEFVRFHSKKNNFKYDLITIIIFLLCLYCITLAIINSQIYITALFIILIIIFLVYRIFYPIYIYKKEISNETISKSNKIIFYFYDSFFKIRDHTLISKLKYSKIIKIYETNDFYYMYQTKNNVFMIDKQGFSIGTDKNFSKFMKNKFKLKYRIDKE